MIYLHIDADGKPAITFHDSTPADYMIDGKSTLRPLYTREEVDQLIQKALTPQ